jgi:hypothetical protein
MHQGLTWFHLRSNGLAGDTHTSLLASGNRLGTSGDRQMAKRSKNASLSCALARLLTALMHSFPHVAAVALPRAWNEEALRRSGCVRLTRGG